jgi:hypothetical protein
MPTLEVELETLRKAELDIAWGEARVAEQELLITRLRTAGHDARVAGELLHMLTQTLQTWRVHHGLILDLIDRLEAGKAGRP